MEMGPIGASKIQQNRNKGTQEYATYSHSKWAQDKPTEAKSQKETGTDQCLGGWRRNVKFTKT